MNKNLNLYEILKNVPKGTKLYSPLFGEVEFYGFSNEFEYIMTSDRNGGKQDFYMNGTYYRGDAYPDAECMLFPSKDQRDWSKFELPAQKVKVTLHPFDKVLVRDDADDKWQCNLFSHIDIDSNPYPCATIIGYFTYCIPYNEKTKHLVGTTDECPIDYEIEFEK